MTEVFEIVVKGHVDQEWDELFEGFSFEHLPDGTTLLRGSVADQPALQGVLMQIGTLGWTLLRVEQVRQKEVVNKENKMTIKGLYRIGLAAAILSTLGWVAFILAGNPTYSGVSGRELFEAWQNDRVGWLMYGWGGVFGALLSIPYFHVFQHALKDKVPASSIVTTIAIIGSVLTAFGFFAALVMIYAWVPAALEASPELLPTIETITVYTADIFEVPWWIGSFMIYCLGVGFMAYYALRTNTGSKWVNIVGIVGGLSGIIWLRYFFRALYAFELIGSLVNILTVTVWAIGLAVSLSRSISKNHEK